jgi:two-component system phosphate regulon sensor histidine kinase PhoR
MNNKHYTWLLYIIVFVIAATITIQVFWNYKNYQQNKQQIFNDIQWSLDNAVENYYADISKSNFLTIINSSDANQDTLSTRIKSIRISDENEIDIDSLDVKEFSNLFHLVEETYEETMDSLEECELGKFTQLSEDLQSGITFEKNGKTVTDNKVIWGKKANDSLKLIKGLSTIYIALQQDTLDYKKMDSIVTLELKKKGISSDFYVNHFKDKALLFSSKKANQPDYTLEKEAKSTYSKPNEAVTLSFKDPISETFKRSSMGILLSTLLILAVISCLFYLLKIINRQKQLAEVKNDLISNITHEFKTPIATIGVALESIKNFNVIDDKEKTKNYLEISGEQLTKLNTIVEKLLETATLDSDAISLHKESVNLVDLINNAIKKQGLLLEGKDLSFKYSEDSILSNVDVFHFENAINNIIDNAIKYGGDSIEIILEKTLKSISIAISDNGNLLSRAYKDKIFEQFYRIPTGNTHDVKGFGIGLYYTKSIIEKHQGTIVLETSKQLTTFKISLPNV